LTHDVIDNRSDKLVDHIRRILPGSQSAKFAVGYFFLSGLESVSDTLDGVRELRLLIGNTSGKKTIDQIAEGYRRLEQVQRAAEAAAHPRRAEMEEAAEDTALNVGFAAAALDQTDEAEQLVGSLVRLIEHDFPRYPNLVQDLEVVQPEQVWLADITYIRLQSDFVYLAVLIGCLHPCDPRLAPGT